MITVNELIRQLKQEDKDALVLLNGYEYGMEYLTPANFSRGKFNYVSLGEDTATDGGLIHENADGDTKYLLFERST